MLSFHLTTKMTLPAHLNSRKMYPKNNFHSNEVKSGSFFLHFLWIQTQNLDSEYKNYGSLGWPPQFQPLLSDFRYDSSLWEGGTLFWV